MKIITKDVHKSKNLRDDVKFGDLFTAGHDNELFVKIYVPGCYCGVASIRTGRVLHLNNIEAFSYDVNVVKKIDVEVIK